MFKYVFLIIVLISYILVYIKYQKYDKLFSGQEDGKMTVLLNNSNFLPRKPTMIGLG